MNKEKLLDMIGDFTWNFASHFFIETNEGNFIWSDPDYYGDNTIIPYQGTVQDYFGDSFGRCKGRHLIRLYCGEDIIFKEIENG